MGIRFLTREEVRDAAIGSLGKTFRELKDKNFNYNNKGTLGQLVERSVFKFANNSRPEPDFADAGIELKLTPYKINRDGTLSAKERLVLCLIDYMNEYKYSFENSCFLHKNKSIELLWYLYDKSKNKLDYIITNEMYISLDDKEFEKDAEIIKSDWTFIINKIIDGKAHELSESDTMYLGACPKGKNSSDKIQQPFNDILAMRRAFCYKVSYMTMLVRKYIAGERIEKIVKKPLKNQTFEEYIVKTVKKYYGKSESQLMKKLRIDTNAKNKFSIIFARMLKIDGDIENTEEFLKANIKVKTIRVENDGKIKESMSFPAFKFEDIINEKWEESYLYDTFENTKFMFVVFRKNDRDEYVFDRVKLWNMPEEVLQGEIKKVWLKTKKIIKSGKIVKSIKNGEKETNFPKLTENKYCHVRPHAKNSRDTYILPVNDKLTGAKEYTKQCFWLNNSYIKSIIEEV
ncbi:MAG: restriction endonuclease [Lachnospiraceae bacterium]|nr:restriction endonuclease [Lachnospiraceae bacterium]